MREDGVTPSNCISDPSYFFEHWRYTMQMKTVGKRSSAAIVEMERDVSVTWCVCVCGGGGGVPLCTSVTGSSHDEYNLCVY